MFSWCQLLAEQKFSRKNFRGLMKIRENRESFLTVKLLSFTVCEYFSTTTLQATVDLIFAAARVIVEQIGMSCLPQSSRANHVPYTESHPPWKKRLNNKIQYLRKDLSRLVKMHQGQLQSQQTVSYLQSTCKYLNG